MKPTNKKKKSKKDIDRSLKVNPENKTKKHHSEIYRLTDEAYGDKRNKRLGYGPGEDDDLADS